MCKANIVLNLSEVYVSNVKDIHGELAMAWLDDLPALINAFEQKWKFRFLGPVSNLSYNFVGKVKFISSGETGIIKMGLSDSIVEEYTWLQSINKGTVRVLFSDAGKKVFAMQELEPGTTLGNYYGLDHDDDATRIIASLIIDLQKDQKYANCSSFRDICSFQEQLHILKGRIDDCLYDKVISLYLELVGSTEKNCLLHGDLHHDNILKNGEDWVVIDPHARTGDPAYEVGSMIYNPPWFSERCIDYQKVISRRIDILSEMLPFDRERIIAWCFCKTILSVAWSVEDHGHVPENMVKIARIIDSF